MYLIFRHDETAVIIWKKNAIIFYREVLGFFILLLMS